MHVRMRTALRTENADPLESCVLGTAAIIVLALMANGGQSWTSPGGHGGPECGG